MKKTTVVLSMMLALLASSAWAQFDGPRQGRRGDRPMQPMQQEHHRMHQGQGFHQGHGMAGVLLFADEIELTDTQQDKIKAIRSEHSLEIVDLKAEAKKSHIIVRTLMRNSDASEGKVMKAIEDASRAKAEIAKARYAHQKQCREILTQEQQDKLEELRLERRKMHFENKGKPGMGSSRGRRFGK
ncbi:MAG: Spy/CpxP family protein refolding chaperone [candidate division Zixibacteria bacterium]|nr:Spy/CpxP family protein refolding chaperone [candidate division Zixibacteria bacterium]